MKVVKKPGFKRVTLSLSPEAVVKLEQLTRGKNKSKYVEKLVEEDFNQQMKNKERFSDWFIEFRKKHSKDLKPGKSAVELIRFDRDHGH